MGKSYNPFIVSARKRFRVYLIDTFILLIFVVLLQSYFWHIMSDFLWALPSHKKNLVMAHLIQARGSLNFFNFSLLFISYHFSCYYYFKGKTIGSYLMKTRLVSHQFLKSSDYQIGLIESLERVASLFILTLAWVYPVVIPLCIISIARKDRRGVADFLGRTYCMDELDFQNKCKQDYNQSLPVPLSFYQEELTPYYYEQKKSA